MEDTSMNVVIIAQNHAWSFIPEMPQHQLPILEVDGKILCQGFTIARYIARELSKSRYPGQFRVFVYYEEQALVLAKCLVELLATGESYRKNIRLDVKWYM